MRSVPAMWAMAQLRGGAESDNGTYNVWKDGEFSHRLLLELAGMTPAAQQLLVTFAAALIAHALRAEFAGALLVYAAGTLFVMVHGPVPLRPLDTQAAV